MAGPFLVRDSGTGHRPFVVLERTTDVESRFCGTAMVWSSQVHDRRLLVFACHERRETGCQAHAEAGGAAQDG